MSQVKIALDMTIAQLGRAGPSVYITRLEAALGPLLGERLVPVASRFARPLGARRTVREQMATLVRDLWWHQVGVVVAARRRGCQLLHLPGGLGPVRSALPHVVTIHDVVVLRFPHLFRPWSRHYAAAVLPRVARAARTVIAVSHAAKAEIVERLGIAEDSVAVIMHGPDAAFSPLEPNTPRAEDVRCRYGLPRDFALTVGSVEPRKNLPRLLEAVHLLRSRTGTGDVALVHAGPAGWLADDVASTMRRLDLDGAVRFLGYVPVADLRVLYGLARLFIYPSLWEGLGLPVLEAMACGCPVVTSGVSAMPEAAGDAGVLVDPMSVEDIAAGIATLWLDNTRRQCQIERGLERARCFSWERTARETVAVYEAAAS